MKKIGQKLINILIGKIMQTIFKEGQIIPQTKLIKLQILRNNYYVQLQRELETLQIRKIQLLQSYINTVKELDKEINKEIRKAKD